MKIKDLKKIIELVSTEGLINEFILKKDGIVNAVDPSNTLLVDLKYNGINLPEDIGFEDNKKFKGILAKFSDDVEVEIKDNLFIIKGSGRNAEIPRRNIDTIVKPKEMPKLDFGLEVQNVPLNKLNNAIKNKVDEIFEQYVVSAQDGMLKLTVGNKETGLIGEDIIAVPPEKNMQSTFWLNIPEVIKTLEKNPTIRMGNAFPLEFSVITEQYSVKYLAAPRSESS